MISESDAKKVAEEFLRESRRVGEPELAIKWESVVMKNGVLVAPYNSALFFETGDYRDQLLDCWPILVDMSNGSVRFALLEDRGSCW
ncbi:YrhB domain-containing protein [Streptomyces sp. NPDC091201]|uniref:YrhB domain-containing protein n=1 Tax=Streptomyces sp. NPDC091201 TaxID=3155190 RepID=UPI0034152D97